MTSEELTTEATELAKGLGLEVTTEGLNHAQLTALVSDLKAKTRDAALDTGADAAEDAQRAAQDAEDKRIEKEAEAAEAEEKRLEGKATEAEKKRIAAQKVKDKIPHVVAPGKSITTRRGILGEGEPIEARDLDDLKKEGGGDRIRDFVKTGHIVKR